MADFETLIWEQEGHVATITLNRPEKLNAMSWTMFTEIHDAFERAATDPEVRCVVITGAGKGFCTGADLTDPANAVTSPFELQDRMRKIDAIALGYHQSRRLLRDPKAAERAHNALDRLINASR